MMIDYGATLTCNRDLETGIRYGIIHSNALPDWFWDEVENTYQAFCPTCNEALGEDTENCICGAEFDEPEYSEEPIGSEFSSDGCSGFVDSSGDAWFTSSPHTYVGVPCSPCAPGAVTIPEDGHPVVGGIRCYGPPLDWIHHTSSSS